LAHVFTMVEAEGFFRLPVLYEGEVLDLPKETDAALVLTRESSRGLVSVPLGFLTDNGGRETSRPLSIPLANLTKHALIAGVPGSGKTNTLNYIEENGCLPIASGVVPLGVDNFKIFLPEFDKIRMVGDGRASSIVQKEAQLMANELFDKLVKGKRSFFWDSSMSNPDETHTRIIELKTAGYELALVAVFTPYETAVHQAMRRAHQTRRFPHPIELPKSHKNFLGSFMNYLDYFDTITVWHNNADITSTVFLPPTLIAKKDPQENELVIHAPETFHSFVPR